MLIHRIAALFVLLIGATQANAQTTVFLGIPSIPGDSTLDDFENLIRVGSWSQSAANVNNMPVVLPLEITHTLDIATPKLMEAALLGIDLGTTTLSVVRLQSDPGYVYQIEMTRTKVVAIKAGGDTSGELGMETVTLSCASFTVRFRDQQSDGTFNPPIEYTGSCGN